MRAMQRMFGMSILAAAVWSGAAGADEAVDIVGIRLGMSLEEAQAAIREYDPKLALQPPVRKTLRYQAGRATRETEPFVSYVFAITNKKQKDDIYVYFSLPPGEPRVVAIERMHNNFDPPISREAYRSALLEKYGEPDAGMHDPTPDESRRQVWYQWHVGDGKQCARTFDGGRKVEGDFGSLSASNVEKGEVHTRLESPADCAALLTYELNYDPLFSAKGTLIDVAGALRSEQAMQTWVDELARGDSAAAPSGAAGKPKL